MADALRNTTIQIDWKVNNEALRYANQETDKIISKAGNMESSYNQSASAINNASGSLGKYNHSAKDSVGNVVQFEKSSKSAYGQAGQGAASAKNNVVQMNREIEQSGSKASVAGNKIKSTLSSAKGNVIDLSSKFNTMADGMGGASSKIAGSIETGINKPLSAAKGIITGLLATAGVAGAGSLFNAGIDRLSSIEDAKMSMEVMMGGDVAKAQGFMDQILDFAKTTPYAFTQLSTSAKNLFAYGMDQGDIVPTLKAIGDLSAASGKGSEGIDSLASAFGKMQVSGKASGEQLTQITEAGVPALKILANQAGISVEDIQKKIADGEVSAKTAIGGLVKGIADGTDGVAGKTQALGGVMEKLKQTWKGSLDSMKSSVTSTMANLVEPAKPKLQEGMKWFSEQFKKLPEVVSNSAKFFAPAWAPAQEVFASGKDFIRNDFLPTVFELGKTMGPGFLEGGISAIKGLGWVVENVVKPPVLWLKEYSEEHPERMKNIAKYAVIGAAGFYAFNKVSGIVKFSMRSIDKLIAKLASIGPTAAISSAQANTSIDSIGQTAHAQATGTSGKFGKVKKAGSWLLKGSAPIQQALPSDNLQAIQAKNALLKSSGQLTMGARASQAMAGTSFRMTQAGTAMKGFAKSIPGLSWLAAGANLIGTNKKNVGEKVGGSGGMLAGGAVGAKLGAGIGTAIAPGIGTAIGTAIGGIGGTIAGSEFGKRMGESIQKNWGSISEQAEKHPILGSPANIINQGIAAGKNIIAGVKKGYKSAKEELDGLFEDPLKVRVKSGKGLSKDTSKKMNDYLKGSEDISAKQGYQQASGAKQTDAEYKDSLKLYDANKERVESSYSAKKTRSDKNLDKLSGLGVVDRNVVESGKLHTNLENDNKLRLYKDTNNRILEIEGKRHNESVSASQKYETEINNIQKKAKEEGRVLTKQELDKITTLETEAKNARKQVYEQYDGELSALQSKQRDQTVQAVSESAKEQLIIFGNLSDSAERISAKQAGDVVKSSLKAKEGSIKEATEKYNETKRLLDEERYVSGSISEEKYNEAMAQATKLRDDSIFTATDMHEQVVIQAKHQAAGQVGAIDWATGDSLTKWDKFKTSSLEIMSNFGTELGKLWSGATTGISKFFDGMYTGAVGAFSDLFNGIGSIANSIIDGINPITTFLVPEWKIPSFKTNYGKFPPRTSVGSGTAHMAFHKGSGANGNYHGPALVGEEGPELAYSKSTSKVRLLGQNGAEMTQVNSGERILNNRDTMKVLNGGYGQGSVLPGFANGLGGKVSDFVQSGVDKGKEVVGKVIGGAKDISETAMEWIADPIGKVTALISGKNTFKNDKSVQGLGFNMINKIGDGAKSWLKEKLADFTMGSEGGSGAYAPRFGSPFVLTSARGARWGTTHNGIDYGAPLGTSIPAQNPGKVSAAGGGIQGFGKWVVVEVAKNLHAVYGHVSEVLTSTGKNVKTGQTIAKVGNEGQSTGPHVHYELRKGGINGTAVDPYTYGAEASGSSPGGSGVERWRPTVLQALAKNGLPGSAAYVNAWMKQIKTESGGNEKAIGGNDGLADGNAMGLLQTKPGTFNAYKHRGFEQILRGLDNALAGINYAKKRYGASGMLGVIGHGHGYATGGRPSRGKTVLVGEKGPELFEADTAGTVHSYDKTKGLFANNNGPSVNYSPTINIEIAGDADSSTVNSIRNAVKEIWEQEYAKLTDLFNAGGVV